MAAFLKKRNQLQWLALLVLAVVLPTVSLLWFMSHVIANERLVVQEKLRVLYQDKLADATAQTAALLQARLAILDRISPTGNPYALFKPLVLADQLQGLVLWAPDETIAYPNSAAALGNNVSANSPLAEAWQAEFAKREYAEAAELYARFATDADWHIAIPARAGRSRCLAKLDQLPAAIAACQQAAFAQLPTDADPALRLTVANARLLLLSLLQRSGPTPGNNQIFQRTVATLLADLYDSESPDPRLPANQNLFVAQRVLEALHGPFHFTDAPTPARLETLVAAEQLSIAAAETLRPFAGQLDVVFRTTLGATPVYALRHQNSSATTLMLLSDTGVTTVLAGYDQTFRNSEAVYRILDASGEFVAGTASAQSKLFNSAPLPAGFPGWKVELYFEGSDVFERAARRQIAVYAWTGFLVILLILIVSGFATRAIGRQIRLNEMKNDFIATVSHELKTPLASMRVLVDTLLEGHVKDEAQVTRYLQLTARENERLSRMIDNFLTFSRMERNKVAFSLVDSHPALMATDAVESVKTKYETNHCQLELEIAAPLPDVPADHDAIVTVLVNLLDNACKYTGEEKRVRLRVFAAADAVCFAVTDNGIGLARRHLRRIFDRFYQVDNSLARKAEGCGLGLSIVKFIVDAHHGKITVESKPGEGSTFTVRLPLGSTNGG